MIGPKPEAISDMGDGVGSGVKVSVGTKVGKKIVGVGAGGVGIGVNVGAGFALTQDARKNTQAVMQTVLNRKRLLPSPKPLSSLLRGSLVKLGTSLPRLLMKLRIRLPLKAGWFA
jgi:hypothetical protein